MLCDPQSLWYWPNIVKGLKIKGWTQAMAARHLRLPYHKFNYAMKTGSMESVRDFISGTLQVPSHELWPFRFPEPTVVHTSNFDNKEARNDSASSIKRNPGPKDVKAAATATLALVDGLEMGEPEHAYAAACQIPHLRSMLQAIHSGEVRGETASRYLGWVQGVVCCRSKETMSEITRIINS